MKTPPLDVLVVQRDLSVGLALAGALRRRGHAATAVASAEDALQMPPPHVLVCDLELPGASGAELLAALDARGRPARAVFVAERPSLADVRALMRLGACDLLQKPFGIDELVQSVERAAPRGERTARESRCVIERSALALPENCDPTLRELVAFLVRAGVGPAARGRIASAAAELLDNVVRHAYGAGAGRFQLRAEIDRRSLALEVADEGVGLDPVLTTTNVVCGGAGSGLARVAALCEDVRIASALGRGTRVALSFSIAEVAFDGPDEVDLSELDFLTPELSRRVLESLRRGARSPHFNLSPALAVSVGRLLAGAPEKRSLQTALWS